MADDCFIYGLVDPRTNAVRYVGKTWGSVEKRRRTHVNCAHLRKTHKDYWILQLLNAGTQPDVVVLETCSRVGWQAREMYWIAKLRADGVELTNGTNGGDGNNGIVFTAEARRKMSEKAKGRRASQETRQLLSEVSKGRIITQEQRDKISRSLTGRTVPEDLRVKRAEAIRQSSDVMKEKQAARWARTGPDERRKLAKKTQDTLASSGKGLRDAPRTPCDRCGHPLRYIDVKRHKCKVTETEMTQG